MATAREAVRIDGGPIAQDGGRVSETELRHSVDDFARVVVFLIRQGIEEGEWSADFAPYQTAALLLGAVNQVIITWLLYRRPRNLTKAGTEIAERVLKMLATEKQTRPAKRRGRRAQPSR